MNIAVVTDGISEYRNLGPLLRQIEMRSPHRFLKPVRMTAPPDAPPPVIARACKPLLKVAKLQKAGLAIVLLDREAQESCPGQIAEQVEQAIARACSDVDVRVAFKDRMLENWLVSDPDALEHYSARFEVTDALRRKVVPGKADRVDAMRLLKSAIRSGQYDKVSDSARILRAIDVGRASRNSRSLRHFLHIAGDLEYQDGCSRPASR